MLFCVGWGRTLYRYRSEAATYAINRYKVLAKDYGLSLVELALRFCRDRQLVTTTLVGMISIYLSLRLTVDTPLDRFVQYETIRREYQVFQGKEYFAKSFIMGN